MALGDELPAVEGDDAGGFLSAMLQRVQAEHGQRAGIGMAENAEHAALLVQLVVDRARVLKASHGLSLAAVACRFDEPV